MIQVNIHEAKTTLSLLLQKVLKGEKVIIAKNNKPVAKLVPIEEFKEKRELGFAKDQIKLSDDFDEPIDDFKEYLK